MSGPSRRHVLSDGPEPSAPGLDVVVCVHDQRRLPLVLDCAAAVLAELEGGDGLFLVCDHAPELAGWLRRRFGSGRGAAADAGPGSRVSVLANGGRRGLSAARDAGVAAGANPIVCFIDDDAVARPGWARSVRDAFAEAPGADVKPGGGHGADWRGADGRVVAIGGAVHPRHLDSAGRTIPAPGWLPPEHGWVFGCDYLGLPGDGKEIRNPIGAAMAIRRDALEGAGGFDGLLGRVGGNGAGGEETEMLLRIRALEPAARVIRDSGFAVNHVVPPNRRSVGYHLSRAFGEGRSKARLSSAPHGDVRAEGDHLAQIIPRAIARGLAAPLRGDFTGPLRSVLSAAVVAAAGLGFATGRTGAALPGANPSENRVSPLLPGGTPDGAAGDAPDLSVVLCTDGRGPHLADAIRAVLESCSAASPMSPELVIVDNSSAGDLHVRDDVSGLVGADGRARIVRAPVRGLSRARNRGIAAARGPLIAFTDDDTIVDAEWLPEIVRGFRDGRGEDDPSIWCVTGRTTAFDLDTDVHRWFEEAISFDKGPVAHVWDGRGGVPDSEGAGLVRPPLYPWPAGCFGSGNNMAFRASAFRETGGFAEELGAGRATRGGEDLDMFRLVVLSGGKIAYRPGASARHHHRDSMPALRAQMFGYGSGMAAALTRCALDDPRHAASIIRNVPAGLLQLIEMRTRANGVTAESDAGGSPGATGYPASLLLTELRGYLLGVPLLLAARAADAAAAFGIRSGGRGAARGSGRRTPIDAPEVRR